ncbi:hypothetical protein [Helicobacter canadensis]|uniref:Uncharacterized protein n=1 Tax=Helicobacter canadensis MIT 98-5491 TaxID=537970 RepID=C5ZYM0_9HELI|nr:hypothetical protein [Helicobacter canadensis]EES90238.1 hypothetical protein HCAN_1533 [Helicobacter canadensis MIT 98-5491]EFR49004.1 hypothetical protein HCMG_01177 [Helicobacter canadensis MIT 98-5491]STO99963.1 Uncharacterised protein [Helicobacter canadensis]
MQFFSNKAMVFYPLVIKEYDEENLYDFLEDKICKILNLRRDCEYFLRYFYDKDCFYCLLINKEVLLQDIKDSREFLTHPAFLAYGLVNQERQFILMLHFCEKLEITLVGYFRGQITFLQSFNDLQDSLEKSQEIFHNYPSANFYFWDTQGQTQEESLGALIKWEILSPKLEELTLEESWNFNPLEKPIPFWKQKIGIILLSGVAGVICGLLYPLFLSILVFFESKNHENLKAQIGNQNKTLQAQMQNYTMLQKESVALQEKYEILKQSFRDNEQFLQKFLHTHPRITQFFDKINPLLELQRIKIAYFYSKQDVFEILFVGANVMEFLEQLEKNHSVSLESLEEIGGFYFVRVKV